jgi:hypothetical protein
MCPCAAKRQPRWRPSVGTGDPAGHSGAACTGARTMRHRYAKEACQLARVDELPAYAHARPARKVRRYHDAPLAAPARLLRRPAPPSLATLHGRTQVSKGCRVTGIQGIRTGRFASADSRASCGHGERRPRIWPSGPLAVRAGFRVDLDNGPPGTFSGSSSPESPEFCGIPAESRPSRHLDISLVHRLRQTGSRTGSGRAMPADHQPSGRSSGSGTISTAAARINGSLRHGQNVLVILDKVCGTSGSRPRERAARAMAG